MEEVAGSNPVGPTKRRFNNAFFHAQNGTGLIFRNKHVKINQRSLSGRNKIGNQISDLVNRSPENNLHKRRVREDSKLPMY